MREKNLVQILLILATKYLDFKLNSHSFTKQHDFVKRAIKIVNLTYK